MITERAPTDCESLVELPRMYGRSLDGPSKRIGSGSVETSCDNFEASLSDERSRPTLYDIMLRCRGRAGPSYIIGIGNGSICRGVGLRRDETVWLFNDEVDGDDGVLERARILLDSPSLLGASKISKIWKCGMGSSASTSHCRVEAALRFLRGLRPVALRAAESSLEVDEVLWRRLTDEAITSRRKPRQRWFWVRIAHSLLARAYLYFQERSCHLDTS